MQTHGPCDMANEFSLEIVDFKEFYLNEIYLFLFSSFNSIMNSEVYDEFIFVHCYDAASIAKTITAQY